MFNSINLPVVKQTIFNAVVGGSITLGAGIFGTHLVRSFQGQSLHGIDSKHPLVTCTKVVLISLPMFYLYKQYGEKHTAHALRSSAYELIFFGISLSVIKASGIKTTPLLSLALILTHLSWKIFASTGNGHLLGL